MSAEPIDFAVVPVAPSPEGWTIADVDALPDRDGVRYELVDGVPHVMTPPRIGHQSALLEVHRAAPPSGCGSDARLAHARYEVDAGAEDRAGCGRGAGPS